jgi:hypothetical protein
MVKETNEPRLYWNRESRLPAISDRGDTEMAMLLSEVSAWDRKLNDSIATSINIFVLRMTMCS